MTDMTDKAIRWVEYQKSLTPDEPFFVYNGVTYFAYGGAYYRQIYSGSYEVVASSA
jgi:hypothetical protein